MNIIQVNELTKSYKKYKSNTANLLDDLGFSRPSQKKAVLNDVSFSLKRGEVLGILGRNGAGKSTLLKALTGVLDFDSGSVDLQGKVAAILELQGGLNQEYTGRENVNFFSKLSGFDAQKTKDCLLDVLDFTELDEQIDLKVKKYSSGMKSRLAFAINTYVIPDILILDEVLSVGDMSFKRKSFERMRRIIEADNAVIFVSHSLLNVKEICTRVLILEQGDIVYDGNVNDGVSIYQKMQTLPKVQLPDFINQIELLKVHKKNIDDLDLSLDFLAPDAQESINITGDGAELLSVAIHKMDGTEVNVLELNKNYQIRVKFSVLEKAKDVSVRVNIKTDKGRPLVAVMSKEVVDVNKGHVVKAYLNFTSKFLQGEYFGNVALIENHIEKRILHRVVDAYSFRVVNGIESKNQAAIFSIADDIKIEHDIVNSLYASKRRKYNIASIKGLNYWAIPKAGNTSIKMYLLNKFDSFDIEDVDPLGTNNIVHKDKQGFNYLNKNEAFSNKNINFTFIRDPVSRFISFYKDFCLKRKNTAMPEFFGVNIDECIRLISNHFRGSEMSNVNPHFRPQSYYISPDYSGLIFSIEDFDDLRVNVSQGDDLMLTHEQRENVMSLYLNDYKLLERVQSIKDFYNVIDTVSGEVC